MSKFGIFALTAALSPVCVAATSQAAPVKTYGPIDTSAVVGPVYTGSPLLRPTNLTSGFEAPAFVPGNLNGQNGWGVTLLAPAPGTPITSANISTAQPLSGAQSLRLTDEATVADGNFTGAFSPSTPGPANEASTVSFDYNIRNVVPGAATGGADYRIAAQSQSQAMISFIVNFSFLGNILVADFDATGMLALIDTGADWTPDTTQNLSVDFVPNAAAGALGGTITYNLNGTPIYVADTLVGGTNVEQVLIRSDNFQVDGEVGDFDNLAVTAVPEPTSLALLGLGGLAVLRRRRA